jgi:hypothetical protein
MGIPYRKPLAGGLGQVSWPNGGYAILKPTAPWAAVFCRFRSTTLVDGFIEGEDTAPVQATGNNAAVSGTGFQSHTFIVLNTALQQEDNPDLAQHLDSFKSGLWDAHAYPLTHRPSLYLIGKDDSDYFPFIMADNQLATCLKLTVNLKDGTRQSFTYCEPLPQCLLVLTSVKIKAHNGLSNANKFQYDVTFEISGIADHFFLNYSLDNGNTWTPCNATTLSNNHILYDIGQDFELSHKLSISPFCDEQRQGTSAIVAYAKRQCPTVTNLAITYNPQTQLLTYTFTDPNNLPQSVQLFRNGLEYDAPRVNAPSTGTYTITLDGVYAVTATTPCTVGDPITEGSNAIDITIINPICAAPFNVQARFAPDGRSVYITWQVNDNTYPDLVKFYDADTNTLLGQGPVAQGIHTANFDVTLHPTIQRFYGAVQHQCPSPSVVVVSGVVQRDNTFFLDLDYTTDPQSIKVRCHRYNQLAPAPFNTMVSVSLSYSMGVGSPINTTASNMLIAGHDTDYIYGSSGIIIQSASITGVNPTTQGGFTYIF